MFFKSKASRFLSNRYPNSHNFQFFRTFVDDVEIKFVRDRGLDHAVEKEKDLKPMINLKNLLKSEPSNSLPLSTIVDNKDNLKISFRPIEFIRKYPCVFEEYFPGNIGFQPHVRLTPEILHIDAEEKLIYDRDMVRKNAADRLLKLLMLCRVNEIPLKLIDRLKWDLGLPDNYATSLVPEFPDYFQVKRGNGVDGLLELVCWSDELAVSVMEKMAKKVDSGFQKGMPVAFPLKYSQGFEMAKRLKKWIDEWQKLPYISPYENASHLQPNSDESDKWAVAVMHELLHILVPKKTDRDNLLVLGEYLGIRSRFKRALVHHPGIFYLSSKIGTYTVVLREGYKRGLLIDKHPLMDMRNKYTHLMHSVKEAQKPKTVHNASASKQQAVKEEGETVKENGNSGKEQDDETQLSDPDVDESSDDEEEEQSTGGGRSGRRGYNKLNEEEQANSGRRGGRRGYNKFNEEEQANSGRRGGRRGYKFNEEEQVNSGRRGGRRGYNKLNEEDHANSGLRDGRRGYNKLNEEEHAHNGHRGGRRGSSMVNEEGQARGRRGSGRVHEGRRKPGRTAEQGRSSEKYLIKP